MRYENKKAVIDHSSVRGRLRPADLSVSDPEVVGGVDGRDTGIPPNWTLDAATASPY
jgi:hypothetical protein